MREITFICFCLFVIPIQSACTTNYDCELNGVCAKGICDCNPGWTGTYCGQLNLVPGPLEVGLQQPNTSTWCGTIGVNNSGRYQYHMFASEMSGNCSLGQAWRKGSQIVHAVSSNSLVGPYSRILGSSGIAIPIEAHNPQIIQAPDKTWLLFDSYAGPDSGCHTGFTPTTCSGGNPCPCNPMGLGSYTFHYSKSLDGGWSPYTVNLSYPCHSCNLTPSPVFHPNGTFFIMFHCDSDAKHKSCDLTMVRAEHWRGPYRMILDGMPVWEATASPGHTEDPFLWLDQHNYWHVILHNGPHGVHIFSKDGLQYNTSNHAPWPFTTTITTTKGDVKVNRRERPWMLLTADKHKRPLALVTSVQPKSGRTFTHVQIVG